MAEDPSISTKSRYELSQKHIDSREGVASTSNRQQWSPVRIKMSALLAWRGFDPAMNLLILSNVVILVLQIDDSAKQRPSPLWRWVISQVLVLVFVLEISIRLFVLRSDFFRSEMNVLDFGVVGLDVASFLLEFVVVLPSTSVVRIFRLGKLLRARRLLRTCREIEAIFGGIMGAARTIIIGTAMISVLLLVWALIAVEILQPLQRRLEDEGALEDCRRCPRAFASVGDAAVTLVQIVIAGDGWGSYCLPLIERFPMLLIFFLLVTMTVDMGILNLMLSAIVDNAHERRLLDEQLRIKEKNDEYARARDTLLKVCAEMDHDGSGQLSFVELRSGYEENTEFFDMLHILDVEQEDLQLIFRALDGDHSGSVSYEEFVAQLHKLKTQETHSMLMFIKCYLKDLKTQTDSFGSILKDLQAEQLEELRLLHTQLFTSESRMDCHTRNCGMTATDSCKSDQNDCGLGSAGGLHKLDQPNGISVLIERLCTSRPSSGSGSAFKLKAEL